MSDEPIRRYAVLGPDGKVPVEMIPAGQLPLQVVEGAAGPSAYDLAVTNGFTGTDAEWLASLAAPAQAPHPHPYAPDSHAIDGAYHSGAEVLPTQGQKNALAGTNGTPGVANPFVTTTDPRMGDARTPTSHQHAIADTSTLQTALDGKAPTHAHPYEPSGAVAAHAGTPHGGATPLVYAVLPAATTALALATNDTVKVTPTGNITYTTTVPAAGLQRHVIVVRSASLTVTFGTGFKAVSTLATGTTANRQFVVSFLSDGINLIEYARTAAIPT